MKGKGRVKSAFEPCPSVALNDYVIWQSNGLVNSTTLLHFVSHKKTTAGQTSFIFTQIRSI